MLIDNRSHRGRINFAQIVVNQDISKTTDGARRAAKVCSYFNRFLEYIFPNMPIQFVLGHHLDGAMKQKGEFFGEGQAGVAETDRSRAGSPPKSPHRCRPVPVAAPQSQTRVCGERRSGAPVCVWLRVERAIDPAAWFGFLVGW
jgi:hypothetical protein